MAELAVADRTSHLPETCRVLCESRPVSAINAEIKRKIAEGVTQIVVPDPGARHNIAVGLLADVSILIEGSVGYYCGGLMDGPEIEVQGSAGWGIAESMMGGKVTVHQNVGNGAAAAIRGGTVVVYGNASARLGVSMKGGSIVVAGDCGYMAGFMGQKGTMIVCGNAGDAFGDSLYSTVCYVGGDIRSLGTDAVFAPLNAEDESLLARELMQLPESRRKSPDQFRKVVAGRRLWNFDKADWTIWKEAL